MSLLLTIRITHLMSKGQNFASKKKNVSFSQNKRMEYFPPHLQNTRNCQEGDNGFVLQKGKLMSDIREHFLKGREIAYQQETMEFLLKEKCCNVSNWKQDECLSDPSNLSTIVNLCLQKRVTLHFWLKKRNFVKIEITFPVRVGMTNIAMHKELFIFLFEH